MCVVILLNERLPADREALVPINNKAHVLALHLRKLLPGTNAHDPLFTHFLLEQNSTPDNDFPGSGDTIHEYFVHSNSELVGLAETSWGFRVRAYDSLVHAMTRSEHNHMSTTRLLGERVNAVDQKTAVQNA